MTDKNKILDRIAKVLAKAEGTNNEAEAEMLMAKVQSMLEEHQLSMIDVATADREDPIGVNYRAAHCWVSNSWMKMVAAQLADYYGCRLVYAQHKNKILFDVAGRLSARVTWEQMLPFVTKQVRAQAKALREKDILTIAGDTGWDWDRAARQVKGVGSYERAVGNALSYRLHRLAKDAQARDEARVANGERALVPVDQVDAVMREAFPDLREGQSRAVKTTNGAREAAAGISLARQTGANTAKQIGGR